MNGPPLAVYGWLRRWSPQGFSRTLQGYFLPASLLGLLATRRSDYGGPSSLDAFSARFQACRRNPHRPRYQSSPARRRVLSIRLRGPARDSGDPVGTGFVKVGRIKLTKVQHPVTSPAWASWRFTIGATGFEPYHFPAGSDQTVFSSLSMISTRPPRSAPIMRVTAFPPGVRSSRPPPSLEKLRRDSGWPLTRWKMLKPVALPLMFRAAVAGVGGITAIGHADLAALIDRLGKDLRHVLVLHEHHGGLVLLGDEHRGVLVIGTPDGKAGGIRLGLHDNGGLAIGADQLEPFGLDDFRWRRGFLGGDDEAKCDDRQNREASRSPSAIGAFEAGEPFFQ